jgi:two-component system CheB/CheR fusion protein
MGRKRQDRSQDEGEAAAEESPTAAHSNPEGDGPSLQGEITATDGEAGTVTSGDPPFPVVGIGASAGGLEAFEQFFAHLPAATETRMAIVLVQHLDPTHKSILSDLVKRYTHMQVHVVKDGMVVEPDCVYIIPPNKDMALLHGTLHLMDPEAPRGLRLPIDFFFRSLAQDQRERAICIVLSGTGTDGTLGLKAIKEVGGMAMAQDPQSAKYDGMPRSAIATGLVDYVLPAPEMAEQLIAYVQHAFGRAPKKAPDAVPRAADLHKKIFVLLRAQTGHDFSYYKQNTVQRRIERRLALHQIERLDDYIRYLRQNPLEVEALFRELLIGVTSFFRDPAAFEVLTEKAIPHLLNGKGPGEPVRVWVPGCSTGEEAYSIAMLLQEQVEAGRLDSKIQIFATDIDRDAIDKARAGVYPNNIAADVSPQRLARFFRQEDTAYHIKKTIRDMVVFAVQNVVEDPPFSRIDLISCRNLLIYMEPRLQKKVVPLFHYALNQDGFLLLGNSESIGEFVDLFAALDRKWKLYQRKGGALPRAVMVDLSSPLATRQAMPAPGAEAGEGAAQVGYRDLAQQTLLAHYTPACAVINERCEVLYIHGRLGKYLEPASGEASLNILRMAREGLRLELTTAIRKAVAQKESVHYQGLRIKANGETQTINLTVQPVLEPASMRGSMMVIFEDVTPETNAEVVGPPAADHIPDIDQRIVRLEQELRAKEEYLQAAVEELETSNEELKSTNEELQSANEELQSTNEELETSKEELQSVNEELVTVNTELRGKLDELARANNDMNNLLAGTEIGTVFVDNDLLIKRFTPAATRVINLIQTDIGRPLHHLVSNLDYGHLVDDVQAVLSSLIPREMEIRSLEGCWYLVHIMPYRTVENVIEGAVMTFVDVTTQKEMQEQLRDMAQVVQAARDYAEGIVDTVREPLVVLDAKLRVVSASRSFYSVFQVRPEETEGQLIYELGNGQWDIPELRELLEDILPQHSSFRDFRVTHDFENIGTRVMLLNAREVRREASEERLILLAIQEVAGGNEA